MKLLIPLLFGLFCTVSVPAQPEIQVWGTDRSESGLGIVWQNDAYYVLLQVQAETGGENALLCKFSESGALVWSRVVGTPGRDLVNSLASHQDGVLVLGRMVEPGNPNVIDDVFLHFFQPDGNIGWSRYFGRTTGGDDEHAAAVFTTDDNHIVNLMYEAVGADRPTYITLLGEGGGTIWGTQLRHQSYDRVFTTSGLSYNGWIWLTGGVSGIEERGLGFLVALNSAGQLQSWEIIDIPGEDCSIRYLLKRSEGFLLAGTVGTEAPDLLLAWANEDGAITDVKRYRDPTGGQLLVASGGYERSNGQLVIPVNRIGDGGSISSDALWLLLEPEGDLSEVRKFGQGREAIIEIKRQGPNQIIGVGSTSSPGVAESDLLFTKWPEAWWTMEESCLWQSWPVESVPVEWDWMEGGASTAPWLAEADHQMVGLPYFMEQKAPLCCPDQDTVHATICAGESYEGFASPGLHRYFIDSIGSCGLDRLLRLEVLDTVAIFNAEVQPSDCKRANGSVLINAEGDSLLFALSGLPFQPEPTFEGLPTGVYTPFVEGPTGCVSGGSPVVVATDCPVYLPSAFSPNGDGRNDVLQLYTPLSEAAEVKFFQVFDRYGGLLYEASGPLASVRWDGTVDGQLVNPGVYTYIGRVQLPLREVEIAQSVTIVR
jgi:gliding motility-associated-like protein